MVARDRVRRKIPDNGTMASKEAEMEVMEEIWEHQSRLPVLETEGLFNVKHVDFTTQYHDAQNEFARFTSFQEWLCITSNTRINI